MFDYNILWPHRVWFSSSSHVNFMTSSPGTTCGQCRCGHLAPGSPCCCPPQSWWSSSPSPSRPSVAISGGSGEAGRDCLERGGEGWERRGETCSVWGYMTWNRRLCECEEMCECIQYLCVMSDECDDVYEFISVWDFMGVWYCVISMWYSMSLLVWYRVRLWMYECRAI